MLKWVAKFYGDYVAKNTPPPENFFFGNEEYKAFLKQTKAIAAQAELFEKIPPLVPKKYSKSKPFVRM